jgi:hypothetical protein
VVVAGVADPREVEGFRAIAVRIFASATQHPERLTHSHSGEAEARGSGNVAAAPVFRTVG